MSKTETKVADDLASHSAVAPERCIAQGAQLVEAFADR
jgi:hypothetical protein